MSSSSEIGQDNRNKWQKKWDGFKAFMYNPNEKTVMGRTGKSWAKIMIFYLFYYGFLACLFAISVTIVLSTLDDYTPRYQTRLQNPGVAIQPKMPSNVEQTSDIIYTMSDAKSVKRYTDVLDKFLYKYAPENQTNSEEFQDCAINAPPKINQDFKPGEVAKACRFDKSVLGKCSAAPYGYDVGKPCIFVKLNRIINWFPVGYTDLSQAPGGGDSKSPSLLDVLTANGVSYKPYLMYTACYGANDDSKKNLGNDLAAMEYFPKDNGMPFAYYPYFGKKRQPGYLNPIVAVQFTNVTTGVEIRVNCKIYAKNIRDNKDMGEGFFSFNLQINE